MTHRSMVFVSLQDAGSQQIGFLLGSCGVTVALTSDACHKGLPKSPTGEIPQFKGQRHMKCIRKNIHTCIFNPVLNKSRLQWEF